MLIELTLTAPAQADYSARDLGYLLHKNPETLHARDTNAGESTVFFTSVSDAATRCVMHLDVDPVALVRGRSPAADGLLDQYVNDRPYVANSFLSVAIGRTFGQSLSGKSKHRQTLADRALPFEVRVTPVAVSGGAEIVHDLFAPLGYEIALEVLDDTTERGIFDLRLSHEGVLLKALLSHLYVLVPVLDNEKHFFIDRDEVDNLLAKGEGWLADHPAKSLIMKRALRHRRSLVNNALARLSEMDVAEPDTGEDDGNTDVPNGAAAEPEGSAGVEASAAKPERGEAALEKPIRLHDLRLDTVVEVLKAHRAARVLDLGCGEGKLIRRLMKERGFTKIVGVDPSVRSLEIAARRLNLLKGGAALRERITLQLGSLTYGDRRWDGFDAAALVEVIEHLEPERLSALEMSLFGIARPHLVIVTTPNRDYNALFESLPAGEFRHADHRFEWSRAEFAEWAEPLATRNGYDVEISPLGPLDEACGAASQMAVFVKREAQVAEDAGEAQA